MPKVSEMLGRADWQWTEKTRKMFWAVCSSQKWSHEQVKELVKLKYNLDSTKDMNGDQVEFVLAWVQNNVAGNLPIPRDANTLELFEG